MSITIAEVKQQEEKIKEWHDKLNEHATLLFVGIVAALGVPSPALQKFAVAITLAFWIHELIQHAQHLSVSNFSLKNINPENYKQDAELCAEIRRAKTACFGIRSVLNAFRFWLALIFLLGAFFHTFLH